MWIAKCGGVTIHPIKNIRRKSAHLCFSLLGLHLPGLAEYFSFFHFIVFILFCLWRIVQMRLTTPRPGAPIDWQCISVLPNCQERWWCVALGTTVFSCHGVGAEGLERNMAAEKGIGGSHSCWDQRTGPHLGGCDICGWCVIMSKGSLRRHALVGSFQKSNCCFIQVPLGHGFALCRIESWQTCKVFEDWDWRTQLKASRFHLKLKVLKWILVWI